MLKAGFKAAFGVVVSKAKAIQQVGHGEEKGGNATVDAIIGNCRGEMGLAAPIPPHQQQPALRVFGKLAREVVGAFNGLSLLGSDANPSPRVESFKSEVPQFVKVAHGKQALAARLLNRRGAAHTRHEFAKLGMSGRHIKPHIAQPVANRAIWVAGEVGLVGFTHRSLRIYR